MSLLNASLQL